MHRLAKLQVYVCVLSFDYPFSLPIAGMPSRQFAASGILGKAHASRVFFQDWLFLEEFRRFCDLEIKIDWSADRSE